NATGFMAYEYGFAAKWLELLKEIAPSVTRVGVIRYAANPAGIAAFSAIQNAAQSLGLLVSPINVRDPREIERSGGAFASSPNGGLVVTQTASATVYRDVIIAVSARQKLPAVYGNRYDATAGGLISYAPDIVDQFRQTAGYVDRILKGAKPDGGAGSLLFCVSAAAQEGYYGVGHEKWHQGFYSKLRRNDGGLCCTLMDCRPTQSRIVGDHYEVKVDGVWMPVPYNKINSVV